MKKIVALLLLVSVTVTVFAQSFKDYFPASKSDYWVYVDNTGAVAEAVMVVDMYDDMPVVQTASSLGNTLTLYEPMDDKIVKIAFTNAFGRTIEYKKPYPLVIGEPGLIYAFNDGDDCLATTENASIAFDDMRYDDCILVTEMLTVGGKVMRTMKRYYAKGIGLVYATITGFDGRETVYQKLKDSNLIKKD